MRKNKKLSRFIGIGLTVIALILVFFIYESIMKPIRFNNERDKRRNAVIDRLKDIRNAQISFRNINGKYTASFDTLIDFVQNGQIPMIKFIADPEDTTFTIQILDTIGYINVRDSLFKKENFNPKKLKFIPYSDNVEFEMDAGRTERGNVMVNVVEVFAANKYFLKDLDDRYFDSEDGLRFGSMTDPTTDGNWE